MYCMGRAAGLRMWRKRKQLMGVLAGTCRYVLEQPCTLPPLTDVSPANC